MSTIPEIAAQMVLDTSLVTDDNSRTIFLVGNKSVGKSTFLCSFLDKTDTTQETLILDYSYGRKTDQKQGIEKIICHIWEYGGKLEMMKNVLTSVPVYGKCFFCVMVDISKIKDIWNTLECCIQTMKETFSSLEKQPELIIICGKYDIFKNYDTVIKKFIYTTLRSVAILCNAHFLLCYSFKDPQLVKRMKDIFHNIGFDNNISYRDKNINHMKPLFIPKGSDSWESIGIASSTLEEIKARHLSQIPFAVEVAPELVTPVLHRNHPEPTLDAILALKYEELRNSNTLDISIDDYLIKLF